MHELTVQKNITRSVSRSAQLVISEDNGYMVPYVNLVRKIYGLDVTVNLKSSAVEAVKLISI